MNMLTTENLTMSSREIADLTGKSHSKVMRDIRVMIEDLKQNPDLDFVCKSSTYTSDSSGQKYPSYDLDRDTTECLLTGYSSVLRMKVIKRWKELEAKQAPTLPQTFAEALQLAADQAKQLELAAPKVAFVENLVDRNVLMTATQVAQKHKMSAVKLNRFLDELGGVYNKTVKRSRAFTQTFVDKGYGEMKQTELGHSQALFTPAGEVWINEQLISEGVV